VVLLEIQIAFDRGQKQVKIPGLGDSALSHKSLRIFYLFFSGFHRLLAWFWHQIIDEPVSKPQLPGTGPVRGW
jgi:hypothetical protein